MNAQTFRVLMVLIVSVFVYISIRDGEPLMAAFGGLAIGAWGSAFLRRVALNKGIRLDD